MPQRPHRHRSSRKRQRVRRPWRLAIIIAGVLAGSYFVTATSWAFISRASNPSGALKVAPWDARAHALLADRLMQQSRGKSFSKPAELARMALQRDATLVPAWRVLAISTGVAGDVERSAAIFRATNGMSRRDLGTRLWLIEDRVRANDIPGALHQYDLALRVEPNSGALLLPILAQASVEPDVAAPLAAMLARRPPWRGAFLSQLQTTGLDENAVVGLLARLKGARGFDAADQYRELAITMINRGQTAAGRKILMMLTPAAGVSIRNGEFSNANPNPPLDWALADQLGVTGAQLPVTQAGGQALVMRGSGGDGGDAARQLLQLPPGTYKVSLRYGRVEGSTPARAYMAVRCATLNASTIAEQSLEAPGNGNEQGQMEIRIPRGCPTQWLLLGLRPSFGPGEIAAWIDKVAISPVR